MTVLPNIPVPLSTCYKIKQAQQINTAIIIKVKYW